MSVADLFSEGKSALERLRQRYCGKLNALRAERRGGPVRPTKDDDFMTGCPALDEQTIVAADTDGNGRFDMLQVWLPPYVAGPYAEGGYRIDLTVDSATAAALKPDYRTEFD